MISHFSYAHSSALSLFLFSLFKFLFCYILGPPLLYQVCIYISFYLYMVNLSSPYFDSFTFHSLFSRTLIIYKSIKKCVKLHVKYYQNSQIMIYLIFLCNTMSQQYIIHFMYCILNVSHVLHASKINVLHHVLRTYLFIFNLQQYYSILFLNINITFMQHEDIFVYVVSCIILFLFNLRPLFTTL